MNIKQKSIIIIKCSLFMAFNFFHISSSSAEEKWIFLENTSYGAKYLHKNSLLSDRGSWVYTMVDLNNSDLINIGRNKVVFRSIVFTEEIDCEEFSRKTSNATYYSQSMATGQEIYSHPVQGKKYFYSKEDWIAKGYYKTLCKRRWEFWR